MIGNFPAVLMNFNWLFFQTQPVCDALLAYVLELCCIFGCPWVRYERRHVNWGALLKLLTTLMRVSTKTRENAIYMVQLAALWLASHDVELMEGKLSPMEKMSYPLMGLT